jgi:HEAT repeat protein
LSLLHEPASALERSAVATTLGNWLGRGLDERILPELLALTSDDSVSVRRVALNIVARGRGPDWREDDENLAVDIVEAPDVLRRALRDEDEDLRRLAIDHLFRRKELSPDDLTLLLPPENSDRVCSEAALTAALSPQPDRFALAERITDLPEYPLTASVLSWAIHRA